VSCTFRWTGEEGRDSVPGTSGNLYCGNIWPRFLTCSQEGVFYYFWTDFLRCTTLRDHPPPKPPFQCPHPNKKGTNLPLFQIGIHLHTHQDLRLKCCRKMGQKLRYGRPCTRDLPGTHNCLAVPHCFYFFIIPLTISCWLNPVSLGLIAVSLA